MLEKESIERQKIMHSCDQISKVYQEYFTCISRRILLDEEKKQLIFEFTELLAFNDKIARNVIDGNTFEEKKKKLLIEMDELNKKKEELKNKIKECELKDSELKAEKKERITDKSLQDIDLSKGECKYVRTFV